MLEIRGVNKRYGTRMVLTDLSFGVGGGRLTGFVGANGAGKTTTMRIIVGVLSADSGTVLRDGVPLSVDDRRRFGYMPEERGLYPKMKVGEQLVYLARLHGLSPASARRNTAELLERLGLGERAGDLVQSLSLGNQQRAQIAAALVHDPEFLVLDEPFSGLDPIAVEAVMEVLAGFAAQGAPVLFSSHQLDIVERLCDDLVIIADGEIRANGSRDELRERHSSLRFELRCAGDAGWVRNVPGITVIDLDGGLAVFEADTDAASQAVLRLAVERGPVVSFSRQRPSLAAIFKEVAQ
ncbi:ABC transporter ATP-binding protein [Cryobacterium sp. TMT1-21]|uniref:ABC transporter ATP-binding protein n=1 Tax=unclassified Cryobacterium TaxID=2649013 RepID=UPI001069DBE4|nr:MULTISPECIES: ATP-binding cassette domain-containing protein [unclassified Cryobacterium]TFC82805.1 ABC transporter ATP-binding protein [Cryobacterium sp. TmT2-59]TFD10645.1 ABC transporter ATP-binding protein [Cryobacterium sp. TMT1-21]TFD12535.1 ABC transporter ATP-binding protein [Cryobacterium sp. TMT4-10]TFD16683.1 ABC transporter ATP-binding protein [Cryobacterium sp. TMT2-23]TFD36537.1 ABC transporter ATP-binding protein [Cryobacterium sp. TMT2-10]